MSVSHTATVIAFTALSYYVVVVSVVVTNVVSVSHTATVIVFTALYYHVVVVSMVHWGRLPRPMLLFPFYRTTR